MKILKWQIVDAETYEIKEHIRVIQEGLLKGYEEEIRLLKEQNNLLKNALRVEKEKNHKEEGSCKNYYEALANLKERSAAEKMEPKEGEADA